jgi:hypothetical protein
VVDLSGYQAGGSARYASIFQQANGQPWYEFMTASKLLAKLGDLEHQGFRPRELGGYNIGENDFYAAVWEK